MRLCYRPVISNTLSYDTFLGIFSASLLTPDLCTRFSLTAKVIPGGVFFFLFLQATAW